MVRHITKNTKFKNAIKESPVVVIDFYAEWCRPCQSIAPVIEAWELEMEDTKDGEVVTFFKCDVDKMSSLSEKLDVTCMPTFLIYQHEALYERVEGADISSLKRAIEKAMRTVDEI